MQDDEAENGRRVGLGCVRIGAGPGVGGVGRVDFADMGHVTKKALDAAQEKFLRQHKAVIEAMAAVSDIEEQREKVDSERDAAIEKINDKHSAKSRKLDLELADAIATARTSMPAKKVASDLGVSVSRQKELTELLEQETGVGASEDADTHRDTDDSEQSTQHDPSAASA